MSNENLIYWKAINEFNKSVKVSCESNIDGVKSLLDAVNKIKDTHLLNMIGSDKKDLEKNLCELKKSLKSANTMVNFSNGQIESLEKFGIEGLIDINNISKS